MPMKSIYRQPLTADGIKKMEEGTLDYFDDEIWSNLNSGTLEQYMTEKTRVEGFKRSKWNWRRVGFGIFMGILFALINQYVGLKVGLIVAGNWYIVNLIGMALKWHPTECNIASGASTGASSTCTGFVFTFPAIYLLMNHPDYVIRDSQGNLVHLVTEAMVPPIAVAMICAMLGGLLGVLYFTIFRRIWLVEDPLPVPGFQAYLKLIDIANDRARGAIEQAKKSLRTMAIWTTGTMGFTFLRDFPISNNASALDNIFGGSYYEEGMIMHPYATYTFFGWNMIPIELAIGWFMKFRTAFLVASGSIFTWFIIVPMAVGFNVPIWVPQAGEYFSVQSFPIIANTWEITDPPAFVAAERVARPIAIGAILGGGITALLKMAKVFKTATADVMAIGKDSKGRTDYVHGKGWFEWPMTQIPFMWFVVIIGVVIMFTVVGLFPLLESIIIGVLLVIVTFILGAIGVKVMGEIGTTPVSGTSFIVLMILIIVFKLLGTDTSTMIILSLIGTTVFGTALSLSADIIFDFKIGVYTGTRPYHLSKAELTAIPFGAIVAAIGAVILSIGLSTMNPDGTPVLNLEAPQAHAFATFTQIMVGRAPWDWILIGIGIGVFAELMTGMGTAFGLGMYLPFYITVNLMIGGGLRDWWQKKKLEPQAKREGWTEKQKTLKLLQTYMMATGLIVGEAVMGTIIAIYLVLPLITGG
ncbi:MAG: OPT/YSL family transporter [Methanomassiliicoccales archaeon]|nr:MAG: OPT/YSL family transporter [Methanomassiliicoccales archaeon]